MIRSRIMKYTGTLGDVVLSICVAVALIATAILAGSCSHPSFRSVKVPRGSISRVVTDADGQKCLAFLPLTVIGELDLTEDTVTASLPWVDALGRVVVIPAVGDDLANLLVTYEPCPSKYTTKKNGCMRIAQTTQWCSDGRYVQHIELFDAGDAVHIYYTLMHELGHALGADLGGDKHGHSRMPWSIMYPSISAGLLDEDTVGDALDAVAQWVRPDDAVSVRQAWGF